MKETALGVAAVALYIGVALLSAGGGPVVRPLFDGLSPPMPYSWVSPPAAFKSQNTPPTSGAGTAGLTATGSAAASISTFDGQATLVVPDDVFAPKPDRRQVRIAVEPIDPTPLGPPPPRLQYAGNAYRFTAVYDPGGGIATPRSKMTVLLRYPATAIGILQRTGSTWTRLSSKTIPASLQIYATTPTLGVFVAAQSRTVAWWRWGIVGAVGVVGSVVGLVLGVRERRRLAATKTDTK